MREEYQIRQHGRDYVLFAGLVAEAHAKFDKFALKTDLIEAGDKPIVKATFEGGKMKADGQFSVHITSTGYGTAGRDTDRKGPAVDAPIEMAETRAKARALRVAVNVGETAFEELSASGEADNPRGEAQRSSQRSSANAPRREKRANEPKSKKTQAAPAPLSAPLVEPETLKRLRFLADTFAETRGEDEEQHWTLFIGELGHDPAELTESDAQKWVHRYHAGLKKLEQEGSKQGAELR